jgi:hypothetical protein
VDYVVDNHLFAMLQRVFLEWLNIFDLEVCQKAIDVPFVMLPSLRSQACRCHTVNDWNRPRLFDLRNNFFAFDETIG